MAELILISNAGLAHLAIFHQLSFHILQLSLEMVIFECSFVGCDLQLSIFFGDQDDLVDDVLQLALAVGLLLND